MRKFPQSSKINANKDGHNWDVLRFLLFVNANLIKFQHICNDFKLWLGNKQKREGTEQW